jgi:WD40 repeat protein
LSNWEQAPVLISRESNYITLHRALYGPSTITDDPSPGPIDISAVSASYKIIDHLTEAVIAPHSLAFTSDGTHFLAGSKNQISLFDLNYTDEPVHKQRTIPSARNNLKGGGVGFKGTVSALGMACSSNMFAAGTWEGHVGLYRAVEGAIEAITHFPLPRKYRWFSREDAHTQALRGSGVTQLKFSPCEKYLYIAERKSDAIAVYDVRNMSIGLGHCAGRKALTNQKFGFDIYPTGSGHEIWAGGIDGAVRVWKDPHCQEGAIEPDYCLSLDQGPVVSTIIHPCGNLTITATGSIEVEDPEEDDFVRTNEIYPKYRTQGSLNMFELGTGTDQAVLQE